MKRTASWAGAVGALASIVLAAGDLTCTYPVAGTPGTFVGNLILVPEPAIPGLPGLGGMSVLVRRRRTWEDRQRSMSTSVAPTTGSAPRLPARALKTPACIACVAQQAGFYT